MLPPQESQPKVIRRRKPGAGRPKDTVLVPPRAQARADEKARNKPMEVTLRMQHTRNGLVYGPGVYKLTRSLALELQHEEEQSNRVEESALIIINEAGNVREVPPSTFEDDLGRAEPAIVQRGKV